jgi:hypothetical protein
MDIEQQRYWAFIAMCASAVPALQAQAEIPPRFENLTRTPYKFPISVASANIGFPPPSWERPSNPQFAILSLAQTMGVKLYRIDL